MLLTISTTHAPATDLGYLLGKNPARTQSFALSFGDAHVYYPEASEDRCTAALLLDIDPVALVRRPQGSDTHRLTQYTNDRPYVASSFMSVAIARVFGQALSGRSRDRAELAATPIPLEARLSVLPLRGGEPLLRALFEPLGYTLDVDRIVLDEDFPQWGDSPYATVTLRATLRLELLLRHLTVLIPVLDDQKHYWVGLEEIDKLLQRGGGWLAAHPEREQIAARYLKHRRSLTRVALERICDEDAPQPGGQDEHDTALEDALEKPLTLNEQRMAAVVEVLQRRGARRVVDIGCGEGRLLSRLVRDKSFEHIVGMDVSTTSLERAHDRLHMDEFSERQHARLQLWQSSVTYRDTRLSGFDAACVVEVIEHIDATRLSAFEDAIFAAARPGCVVITTPNAEYNVRFESLPAGSMRHRDHRFEWTRVQFERWANKVGERHAYHVQFEAIGPHDDEVGSPTQMAVFSQ